MRFLSAILFALVLTACGDAADAPADPASPASADAQDTPAVTASRTYTRDDRDTFCETVVTEALVREHFDIAADAPLEMSGRSYGCSGWWGADSRYDDAASSYNLSLSIANDETIAATRFAAEAQDRTAAENQALANEALASARGEQPEPGEEVDTEALVDEIVGGVGGTRIEPIEGLGDEAAVMYVEGSAPSVIVRVGNVLLSSVYTFPNALGQDVEANEAEIAERSVAFARAVVGQM